MVQLPRERSASVTVLHVGRAARDGVASTVSYVRDGDAHVVIDPGMVPGADAILDPLRQAGCTPEQVTDVILSHHHPDHTLHAGLFPNARVHDHWAIYHGETWDDRPAEGFEVSPSIRLLETPGHTPQDITTLVGTDGGIVAFTHVWWNEQGPAEDPRAWDLSELHRSRGRVLEVADRIVPGHGAAFTPSDATPH